ncbi:MAG: dephospho-CoA kinase [Bifidobacteriaceae bacterium]|nr:dephospho-CoA kinase [Bifidobacteriaceae bacterium]
MLRVGLTGGIGAGKSTALDHLAELGFPVADSDALARLVVAPGSPGLAAVALEFGPGVLAADGSVDRAALGRIVFADPAARRRLEALTHPLIRAEAAKLARAARLDAAAAMVFDIPLLVETGQAGDFDLVATISAPEATRLARLAARGLGPDQARARLAAQASDAEREARADVVLDGSGSPADLRRQIDSRLLPAITRLAGAARANQADQADQAV